MGLLLILLVFLAIWARNLLEPFRAFTVTISNESDYDIVSVETGIVSGSSKHPYAKIIGAGEKVKIKPDLTLMGEGSIYQEYTDSNGDLKETVVCGYTEYVSGHSKVIIRNDRIDVEQNCM